MSEPPPAYVLEWEKTVEYCASKHYWATWTELKEEGPSPDIDYASLRDEA